MGGPTLYVIFLRSMRLPEISGHLANTFVDSARTSTSYGDRAFSAVAPALWNAFQLISGKASQ